MTSQDAAAAAKEAAGRHAAAMVRDGMRVGLGTGSTVHFTIVALGEMLGLTTVAEGIERAAQRDHLSLLGCTLGQGYHFARPLPPEALTAMLEVRMERAVA